jgi:hypothetical protein
MEHAKQNYCCPNCQTLLSGSSKFCSNCGQKRIHPEDYSVWHLMVESVGDFFHLDSKFFATLWPLFFRPGFLTNEYLQGKKARYFQPFKLFLFISFLFFLTAGLMNHKDSINDAEIAGINNMKDSTGIITNPNSIKLSLNEAYDKILALPDDSLHKAVKKYGLNRFVNMNFPREAWLARFMIKQILKNKLQGSVTFWDNMNKTVPKLIFILIPIIAMLLKLIYIRKKIPYFNHIIFSLHFLSFVFLMLWIKEFGSLISSWFNPVIFFLMLVYLYFALLGVYRRNKWATLGKFILLFFGILTILAVFVIIAASVSFMMI